MEEVEAGGLYGIGFEKQGSSLYESNFVEWSRRLKAIGRDEVR